MATDFSKEVAQDIIDRMRAGTAPWQRPWEPGQLRSHFNPKTGKPYRGFNQIWLDLQGRSDPRWMTYNQAAEVGGQVRKGERGTTIEYWQWSKDEPAKDDNGKIIKDADGQTVMRRVELSKPRRFSARVFNAEQIDGLEPLPPTRLLPDFERHQQAETILSRSPAPIRHIDGDRAYYEPIADRITLPLREQFKSPDLYYATAFHELGHSSGHESRLNRDLLHPFGSEAYAREELVAEIASYMMAQRMGMAFDPGHHVSYLESWLRRLEQDPREIFRAAAEAEKVVEWVIGLEREVEREQSAPGIEQEPLAPALTAALDEALARVERENADLRLAAEVNAALNRQIETYLPGQDLSASQDLQAALLARERLWMETDHPLSQAHQRLRESDRLGSVTPAVAAFHSLENPDQLLEDQIRFARQFGVPPAHVEILVGILGEAFDGRNVQADFEAFASISEGHLLLASTTFHSLFRDRPSPEWAVPPSSPERPDLEQRYLAGMIAAEVNRDRVHSGPMLAGFRFEGVDDVNALIQSWSGVEPQHGRLAVHAAEMVMAFGAVQRPDQAPIPQLADADQILSDFGRVSPAHFAALATLREQIDAAVSQPVRETLKAYALTAAEVSAEIPAERTSMASDRAANVRGDTQQKDALMRSEDAAPIIAPARVNLDVPFADKNEAKAAGAKWDKTEKTWFAPKGTDLAPLARWTGARAEEPELVPEVEFKEFLESHGYVFDKGELPIMDGEIHRQKVDGDKGSERSGAYVGYTDDHPAGFMERFGSKGYKLNWKSQQRTAGLSKEDRDRLAREGEAKQAERLAVRQAGYERAAAEVEKIVAACEPAPGTHRYLDAKNVLPSGVLMMTGIAAMPPGDPDPQQFGRPGNLLIPAHDIDGKVWTAQSISPGGMKSFPRGARLHGCHHLIGEASREGGDILVCEGWATGQTIHEATGKPVAVAFNANNLEAVAREYRDRFPDKAILILGDNDHRKEAEIDPATNLPKPNVGKEKAIAAARAVGGQAVLPPFRPTDQGSDWNDFATIHGEAATRRAIQEQLAIAMRRELTEEITASRDIDRDQPAQEREREREQGRAAMPDRDDDRPRRDLDPDRDRQREQDRDREPALTMGR